GRPRSPGPRPAAHRLGRRRLTHGAALTRQRKVRHRDRRESPMNPQIVFVTLFLGIVAGPHAIDLQVTGPVASIRMLIGDREIAQIAAPPWHTDVVMGTDLAPRELVAVGYDAQGKEIARTAQILNLPRPLAEFEIIIDGERATLHPHHLMDIKPLRAAITVDGKPVAVERLRARLPKF